MCTSTQLGHNIFRILLYRNAATELLLESASRRLRLPAVMVPTHARVAEEITTAITSTWSLETYCLFPLRGGHSSHGRIQYQVAELSRPSNECPSGMAWWPIESLSSNTFEDSSDFEMIETSRETLHQNSSGEPAGAFGGPGWMNRVTAWVEAQAIVSRLSLTGKFRQLNSSPTFSLIRFETNGPAVWFKAVGEPNLREFPITMKLGERFPTFVPKVIGSRREWSAWLAIEADGTCLVNQSLWGQKWGSVRQAS
jgi:hypothetical protein